MVGSFTAKEGAPRTGVLFVDRVRRMNIRWKTRGFDILHNEKGSGIPSVFPAAFVLTFKRPVIGVANWFRGMIAVHFSDVRRRRGGTEKDKGRAFAIAAQHVVRFVQKFAVQAHLGVISFAHNIVHDSRHWLGLARQALVGNNPLASDTVFFAR